MPLIPVTARCQETFQLDLLRRVDGPQLPESRERKGPMVCFRYLSGFAGLNWCPDLFLNFNCIYYLLFDGRPTYLWILDRIGCLDDAICRFL